MTSHFVVRHRLLSHASVNIFSMSNFTARAFGYYGNASDSFDVS